DRTLVKYLKSWQEWQGSNLRPPGLETGALPIELHSCREPAHAPVRAVSSIGHAPIARAKLLCGPIQSRASGPDFVLGTNNKSNGRIHEPPDRRPADIRAPAHFYAAGPA